MSEAETLSTIVVRLGVAGITVTIVLLAILQWLIAMWFKARLETSLKSYYDTKLANFQYELRMREKAATIADFFSEWGRGPSADKVKLRRLSMELSLVLPTDLYREFAKCTTYQPNGPNSNKVIIAIRRHMLGKSAGTLSDSEIVDF